MIVENIPAIDYVLIQPDGRTLSIAEAAKPGAPYDWIVASHVIEHVPDVIGWLSDLAEIAVDDGALVLVVPDQRFTFDVHRPLTTVGQMLQAHQDGDQRPSVRAVYDHYSATVAYNGQEAWRGSAPTFDAPAHPWWQAAEEVERSLGGDYVDCHVWLFTPESFLRQMRELRRGGHSTWYVEKILPDQAGRPRVQRDPAPGPARRRREDGPRGRDRPRAREARGGARAGPSSSSCSTRPRRSRCWRSRCASRPAGSPVSAPASRSRTPRLSRRRRPLGRIIRPGTGND